MKTRTATSNSNGSNLQAGLAMPARLARVGVAALTLAAVSAGLFGAGSASADEPRRLGQAANAQVVQTTQIKQTLPKGNLTKVNTNKVAYAKVSATADGKWSQQACDQAAGNIQDSLTASDAWAAEGRYEDSFIAAKQADESVKEAVAGGCIVIIE